MAHQGGVSRGRFIRGGVLAAVGVALAGGLLPAEAAVSPALGAARTFAVLSGVSVTSGGLTIVKGDLGVSPGTSITGFGPGIVRRGSVHAGDATAAAAAADAATAYAFLAGMTFPPANDLSGTDLGGLTLLPGVYSFSDSAQLTGALVLDAQGDPGALFVIQVAGSLTTASGATVVVINGGPNYNEARVFWQVGSSATLGSGTAFTGNILAYAGITLVSGSTLVGNALALTGGVTLDGSLVTSPRLGRGDATGLASSGRTKLTLAAGSPAPTAVGRIEVDHITAVGSRTERSVFRLSVRNLVIRTKYTLWANDPLTPGPELVQFGSFTTLGTGRFTYSLDTRKGGAMPFGATLAEMSGEAFELRDAAGSATLLTGTIPTTSR